MASINLSGILTDPTTEASYGMLIRFIQQSTTGDTLKGSVSLHKIPESGVYDFNLNYGNVMIETQDPLTYKWRDQGTVTINEDTPATSIPALIGITEPTTDADLLVFQALVADAELARDESVTAKDEVLSRVASYEVETTEYLINTLDSSILSVGDVVKALGFYDSSGDGYGRWVKTSETGDASKYPAELGDATLTTSNGDVYSLIGSTVFLESLGLKEGVDNHDIILAALKSGKSVACLKKGDYTTLPIEHYMMNDTAVELGTGVKFSYFDAVAEPLFTFRDDIAAHQYDLKFTGGAIDNSEGLFVESNESNTCIALIRIKKFEIENVNFLGASTYNESVADSGITTVDCLTGDIKFNTFKGQNDAGIYISNGTTVGASDAYEDVLIMGNTFEDCRISYTFKRAFNTFRVIGNETSRGYVGLAVFEAGGLDPSFMGIHTGNTYKRMYNRIIDLRATSGFQSSCNRYLDFGLDENDETPSEPYAIQVRGCSGHQFTNEYFENKNITANGAESCFKFQDATVNGVDYICEGSSISNCSSKNVANAVIETGNAGYNDIRWGTNDSAAFTVLGNTKVNKYDNNGERTYIGGVEVHRNHATKTFVKGLRTFDHQGTLTGFITSTQTVDIGEISAGTVERLTLAIAGVEAGDYVQIYEAATIGLNLVVGFATTGTDTVTLSVANISDVAITLPTKGWRILVTKM